ncbi:hypothetical protein P7L78_10655 [Tistrella bauzanensis]|uniref:Uncharacterized protein n=1 Tax=Tistrella arctica TaxID=3133430 RepID=A0ABU9YQY4_9PROT
MRRTTPRAQGAVMRYLPCGDVDIASPRRSALHQPACCRYLMAGSDYAKMNDMRDGRRLIA